MKCQKSLHAWKAWKANLLRTTMKQLLWTCYASCCFGINLELDADDGQVPVDRGADDHLPAQLIWLGAWRCSSAPINRTMLPWLKILFQQLPNQGR